MKVGPYVIVDEGCSCSLCEALRLELAENEQRLTRSDRIMSNVIADAAGLILGLTAEDHETVKQKGLSFEQALVLGGALLEVFAKRNQKLEAQNKQMRTALGNLLRIWDDGEINDDVAEGYRIAREAYDNAIAND